MALEGWVHTELRQGGGETGLGGQRDQVRYEAGSSVRIPVVEYFTSKPTHKKNILKIQLS